MENNSDMPTVSRVTPVIARMEDIDKTTNETLSPFKPNLSKA